MPTRLDRRGADQKFEIRTSGARAGGGSFGRVDGYGQFCPIALGAEVFAERWTPIILRNLMVGCERFGEILAGAPGLPRSVLSTRLRRLERDGVVQRTVRDGAPCYRLTECGAELTQVCLALGTWGARWREVRPEHLDPYLAAVDAVHAGRTRTRCRGRGWWSASTCTRIRRRTGTGWSSASSEREVCVHDPGFGDDAVVASRPGHAGRLDHRPASRSGTPSGPGR